MNLIQIRQAYDRNYKNMIDIIREMGGEKQIKYHRRQNSKLFRQLKRMQKLEHQLDTMETKWQEQDTVVDL